LFLILGNIENSRKIEPETRKNDAMQRSNQIASRVPQSTGSKVKTCFTDYLVTHFVDYNLSKCEPQLYEKYIFNEIALITLARKTADTKLGEFTNFKFLDAYFCLEYKRIGLSISNILNPFGDYI
jgi:hypothetical protein